MERDVNSKRSAIMEYDELPSRMLVRIQICESDRVKNEPLYKKLIKLAKERDIFSVVALRGIMSYNRKTGIRSVSPIRLSMDLPLVVEVLDDEDSVMDYIGILTKEGWLKEAGHISIERVKYL